MRLGKRFGIAALFSLAVVAVDRCVDHSLSDLLEVLVQRIGERDKLWPQRLFVKRLRRHDLHGAVALTFTPVRLQPISTTEREEESALPGVGQSVRHDDLGLEPPHLGEPCANSFRGKPRGFALAVAARARV